MSSYGVLKRETRLMPFASLLLFRYASGCVVECRIRNREVAGSNPSLGYFEQRSAQPSIPPGSVMSTSCGRKAKAGMAHSDCGWTCGCAGKTEIPCKQVPYLSASAVVTHYEEALYQVYAPLPYLYLLLNSHRRTDIILVRLYLNWTSFGSVY